MSEVLLTAAVVLSGTGGELFLDLHFTETASASVFWGHQVMSVEGARDYRLGPFPWRREPRSWRVHGAGAEVRGRSPGRRSPLRVVVLGPSVLEPGPLRRVVKRLAADPPQVVVGLGWADSVRALQPLLRHAIWLPIKEPTVLSGLIPDSPSIRLAPSGPQDVPTSTASLSIFGSPRRYRRTVPSSIVIGGTGDDGRHMRPLAYWLELDLQTGQPLRGRARSLGGWVFDRFEVPSAPLETSSPAKGWGRLAVLGGLLGLAASLWIVVWPRS